MKLSRRQNQNPAPPDNDRELVSPHRLPLASGSTTPGVVLHPQSAIRNPQSKVTLEDLLRFKRAERPAPEFWAGFETQLKQRQLAAAIHEQHPWWRAALPRFAIALPVGATAALAIGIIVWRNDAHQAAAPAAHTLATTAPAPAEKTGSTITGIATTTNPISPAAPATSTTPVPDENNWHAFNVATPPAANKPTAAEVAATQPVSEEHIQTAHAAFAATRTVAAASHFARAALASARPALTRNISSSTLMAMPVLAADLPAITLGIDNTTAEKNPAATTDSPNTPAEAAADTTVAKADDAASSSPRYARLISSYKEAAATPVQTPDNNPRAMRVRERATDRLNNKLLTDSVSRFGATGDSLSIKF